MSQSILLFLFLSLGLFTFGISQDEPTALTTQRPSRFARLLGLKDRIVDRVCDSASSLFTRALGNCTSESYCEKMKTVTENLPVGCGILNDGLNDTLRRLAFCVRRRNQECINGILEDLQEKYEQAKTVREMAGRRRKK